MNYIYCIDIFLILSTFPNTGKAARILAFFPTASISHQVIFRPLTQELAKRGHEVVVITTDPAFSKGQTPTNLTEIDVHNISYKVWNQNNAVKEDKSDLYSQCGFMFDLQMNVFEEQLQNEEVHKVLFENTLHFDLLLLESCVRPLLALTHLFTQVPTIQISSLGSVNGNYESVGTPVHPTIYSSFIHKRIYDLSIAERLTELKNHFVFEVLLKNHAQLDYAMLQRIMPFRVPSYDKLKNNIDMLFLNIHEIWESPRPVPQSVVHIGGIHVGAENTLTKDLQAYLDQSQNGVIYFSFGSNILPSELPRDKLENIVKVLSQLPYDILFKWDKNELPGAARNIKIKKWFPQFDLLKHPKMKLFITQAGLQSTEEAIIAGVPLLGIPMMLDQWYNAEKYEHNKIGLKIDFVSLTETKFREAITTILQNDSFRQNVVRLRTLMRDQQKTALDRAVWWTEHVLRHGGAQHLRAPGANMPWTEYYEVELICIVLISTTVIISFLATIFCKGIRYIFTVGRLVDAYRSKYE